MNNNIVWVNHDFQINYENLDTAINKLQAIRDSIPEMYRKFATIDCSYGEDYFYQRVSYYRPENEQEKSARLAREDLNRKYILQRLEKDLKSLTSEERKALGV